MLTVLDDGGDKDDKDGNDGILEAADFMPKVLVSWGLPGWPTRLSPQRVVSL